MTEPIDATINEATVYSLKNEIQKISLTQDQKNAIRTITESIREVDEDILEMAIPDIFQTIENGNPLNRLLMAEDGKVTGYIACEDWGPNECYIKYLGTNRSTGRNLFSEIPAFLKFAKSEGYEKLSFHGWNDRLNRILEHFGFEHTRDDEMGSYKIPFLEKKLT